MIKPYVVMSLFLSGDFKIMKRTNIKKRTRGRMARTPSKISTNGVLSKIDSDVSDNGVSFVAAAMISAGVINVETYIARHKTAKIGNKDAMVTTPKPDNEELSFLEALAIPIPKDKTSGTVTGPVVTAPQSHARPNIDLRSSSNHA